MLLMVCSCRKKSNSGSSAPSAGDSVKLSYARGFSIINGHNWTVVEITRPYQGATRGYKYLLVPHGEPIPDHEPEVRVIRTPVKSVVCTSTTHIPLLDYLGVTDCLTGFPTTDYISSEKARLRIDSGKVVDLGVDKGLNFELLVNLKPELVIGYTMSSDYGQFRKIEEFGIPVVLNAEYLEKHPLGRAEWIKFVAEFFDKEKEADSIFNMIERSYNEISGLSHTVAQHPTVVSGILYGDAWFLPGGQNYASRLLNDAGCSYLWQDNPSQGYLELSFEAVYEQAHHAELWIGVGPFTSLEELSAADHRYEKFRAFKTGNVYNYDARKGAKGGNEYLELGYLRPDIILKDLVRIAHPDLLPDHILFFHRRLR